MKKFFKKTLIYTINKLNFFIKKFVEIKDNKICFGGKFYGNSKYLFLYLSSIKSLKVYWLTTDKKLMQFLQNNNQNSISTWSIKAIYILLSSKFFFFNSSVNNISDLNFFDKKKKFINLWHGNPIKKIFYSKKNLTKGHKEYLKNFFKNFNYFNVHSKILKKKFKNAINTKKVNIISCGSPANDILYKSKEDILFSKIIKSKVRKILKITKKKKIILYCPTHRQKYTSKQLENLNIFFKKIKLFLIKNNIVMLVRFHPLDTYYKKNNNFKSKSIYNISNFVDVTPFLIAGDVLITDYSSIIFDYSILDKPYLFYHYDFKEYCLERNFYYKWSEYPTKIATNPNQLIRYLDKDNYFSYKKNKKFSKKYNTHNALANLLNFFFPGKKEEVFRNNMYFENIKKFLF